MDLIILAIEHVENTEDYLIEKIVSHRGPACSREFKVKFIGYTSHYNLWYPEETLLNVNDPTTTAMLSEYIVSHRLKSVHLPQPDNFNQICDKTAPLF